MALSLSIGLVDHTAYVATGTLQISDEISGRNTCTFELVDPSCSITPDIGSAVDWWDGTAHVYAGTIDEFEKWFTEGPCPLLRMRLTCIDWTQLMDRHLVSGTYKNMKAGAIVKALFGNSMATRQLVLDGVTDFNSHVQDGPVIPSITFNYCTLANALDQLADRTTFKWMIDYSKVVWFFNRATYPAPQDLRAGLRFRDIKFRRTRENYRNYQFVRGGKAESVSKTITRTGDGVSKTFTLDDGLRSISSLTVGGVAQVVSGDPNIVAEWNFTVGGRTVTRNAASSAPGNGVAVVITYTYEYPILVRVPNQPEIDKMKGVEGGSGYYEAVETNDQIKTQAEAIALGQSLLAAYGKAPRLIEYEIDTGGFLAGQVQTVDLPNFGLNREDFLIYRVQASSKYWNGQERLRYRVQLVGSEAPQWLAWFRGLANAIAPSTSADNEVILLVQYAGEKVQIPDTLTRTAAAVVTDTGLAIVGHSEVAA